MPNKIYAKCKDGVVVTYPYTFATLLQENPYSRFTHKDIEVLFPQTEQGLAGAVLMEVTETPLPAYNKITQSINEDLPVFVEGVLTQKFTVVSVLPDQAAANLVAERARLTEEIKRLRDDKALNGCWSVVIDGVVRWFHSDLQARSQHQGNAREADRIEVLGGDMDVPLPDPNEPTEPLRWQTKGGPLVIITPRIAQAIMVAAKKQEAALFRRGVILQMTVNAHPAPHTVDINAGWPETYTPPA